jgi:predicted methyltransferase
MHDLTGQKNTLHMRLALAEFPGHRVASIDASLRRMNGHRLTRWDFPNCFAIFCSSLLAIAGCAENRTAPTTPAIGAPASSAPLAVSTPAGLYGAIVDASDRSPEDRALDAGRHPNDLLAFLHVQPGMHVAELGAGGGYTTELLARSVGPTGTVYGQNSKFILERFAEKPWSARLAKPVMKNVVRVDRPFDDPLPPEAHDLDAVVMVLFYHDTVWQGVDRDKMNRAIFSALRPGGWYVIVDHSGRAGTGVTEVQTLHRIEEQVVRDEITRAGFRLASEGSFLRSSSDTRDWNASPRAAGERRGTSDRFVLGFSKP